MIISATLSMMLSSSGIVDREQAEFHARDSTQRPARYIAASRCRPCDC
jgi:hypothetical protein